MATLGQAPDWARRHALVTGGARGIGRSVTQALLAQGARVTVLGRSLPDAQALRALAGSSPSPASTAVTLIFTIINPMV